MKANDWVRDHQKKRRYSALQFGETLKQMSAIIFSIQSKPAHGRWTFPNPVRFYLHRTLAVYFSIPGLAKNGLFAIRRRGRRHCENNPRRCKWFRPDRVF